MVHFISALPAICSAGYGNINKAWWEGFTKKYDVHILVHVEFYSTMEEAIHREKCIKEWKRNWKLELIEKHNPEWNDLYETINA